MGDRNTVTEHPASAARKFLNDLAEEPFLCVVVADDEVRIFSKSMDPERLARVNECLEQAIGGR